MWVFACSINIKYRRFSIEIRDLGG
jgi:hypothetical protein